MWYLIVGWIAFLVGFCCAGLLAGGHREDECDACLRTLFGVRK